VRVIFANRDIPKSPYAVSVEGFAGDASKVTAAGPGLEADSVVVKKPTYFHIYAQNAGKGTPEVIILDPKGKKDSTPVKGWDSPNSYQNFVTISLPVSTTQFLSTQRDIPDS
jgi:pectate lyase